MGNMNTRLDVPEEREPVDLGYDPRIHLTLKASSRKAVKIYTFLPDKVKERIQRNRREWFCFAQGPDGAVSFQAKEPDTYSVTPGEWNAANFRIMGHLLASGELARDHVEYYMAYSVQINDMLDVYDWQSIQAFDTRYRELQAEHGFRWGDLRLAAHSSLLLPKKSHNQHQQNTRIRSSHPQGPSKTEDCKKWLASGGKQCPFGPSCRYLHRTQDQLDNFPKNGPAPQAQTGL
jgi:hypothetical protein